MGQQIKCLPDKLEDLNSCPQNPCKAGRDSMLAQSQSYSEMQDGDSRIHEAHRPGSLGHVGVVRDPFSNKVEGKDLIPEAVLLPSHMSCDRHKCPCSHTEHTHAHLHRKGDGGRRWRGERFKIYI